MGGVGGWEEWEGAHVHSQLKHQNLGWVVVQRKCLNDSILHASAHLNPKLAARGH